MIGPRPAPTRRSEDIRKKRKKERGIAKEPRQMARHASAARDTRLHRFRPASSAQRQRRCNAGVRSASLCIRRGVVIVHGPTAADTLQRRQTRTGPRNASCTAAAEYPFKPSGPWVRVFSAPPQGRTTCSALFRRRRAPFPPPEKKKMTGRRRRRTTLRAADNGGPSDACRRTRRRVYSRPFAHAPASESSPRRLSSRRCASLGRPDVLAYLYVA